MDKRSSFYSPYSDKNTRKSLKAALLTSCSRTKEQLAERVKKVEKGVEVKKQQNNGNHSYASPDPSLYIAILGTVMD